MASYVFDGNATYTGTADGDQFYMQDATVSLTINGQAGGDYVRGGRSIDIIYGGDGDDYIYAGAGGDTVYGGAGNDVLNGAIDNGNGTISSDLDGSNGYDLFSGNARPVTDYIYGNDGNDLIYLTDLSGDIGYGGLGDDTFIIQYPNSFKFSSTGNYPRAVENANEGIDTVIFVGGGFSASSLSNYPGGYTLANNIEILILENFSGSSRGVGNELDNTIIGNSSENSIEGNGGDDLINAAGGNDTILGGTGNDALYGGDGNDLIYGDDGNDTLFGDAGVDMLYGGMGNDIYSVENLSDIVQEAALEGYDEVYASVDFALSDNVETLILTGSAVYATGNAGNNALIGNDLDNVIDAGAGTFEFITGAGGNDILIGGAGHDEINGGAGNDVFRFTAVQDAGDFIYDFTPGQDHIQLNATAFGIGTDANPLLAGVSFINGSDVTSAVPTLLYTQANGTLFYDADGTGAQAPVVLAILNGTPALTAADFLVY